LSGGAFSPAGAVNNAGSVTWTAGNLDLAGAAATFNNQSGAAFNAQGAGSVTGAGAFHNLAGATLTKSSAGVTDFQVMFDNAGTVNASAGTLEFSNAAGYVQSGGLTRLNGGSLIVSGVGGMTLNGGVLAGTGSLTAFVANDGATVRPGGSPGTLSIVGHYSQGPGGTLEVELGGLTQGVTYDLLSVSGAPVALGGTLNVLLYGGYTGSVNDIYDVIFSSGGFSGSFAAVNLPQGYALSTGVAGDYYRLGITGIVLPLPVEPPVVPLPASSRIESPASQVTVLQDQAERVLSAAANVPQEPAEEQDRRRRLRECR
jgi:hypothetical protein